MSTPELILGMLLVFSLTILVRKFLGRYVEMPERDPLAEAERLMAKGQYDAAERYLQRALEIEPLRQALVDKLQEVRQRRASIHRSSPR